MTVRHINWIRTSDNVVLVPAHIESVEDISQYEWEDRRSRVRTTGGEEHETSLTVDDVLTIIAGETPTRLADPNQTVLPIEDKPAPRKRAAK